MRTAPLPVSPVRQEHKSAPTPATAPISLGILGIGALWLMGLGVVLARLFLGMARVQHYGSRCLCVEDSELASLAAEIAQQMGVRRSIALRLGTLYTAQGVPITWGWRHPTILLPLEALTWPRERLRVVLLHEIAHIRRADWLTRALTRFDCVLSWFHPLVWWLDGRCRLDSERACDAAVLNAGIRASTYAHYLLEIVTMLKSSRPLSSSTVSMAQPSQIEQRIKAILIPASNRRAATRGVLTLTLALSVGTVVSIAGARIASRPLPQNSQKPSSQTAHTSQHRKFAAPYILPLKGAPGYKARLAAKDREIAALRQHIAHLQAQGRAVAASLIKLARATAREQGAKCFAASEAQRAALANTIKRQTAQREKIQACALVCGSAKGCAAQ